MSVHGTGPGSEPDVPWEPHELIRPPDESAIANAIENAELMIDESIADLLAIRAGGQAERPSHRGSQYDMAYAQGRKDACRVLLISLGVTDLGKTTDTVRGQDTP